VVVARTLQPPPFPPTCFFCEAYLLAPRNSGPLLRMLPQSALGTRAHDITPLLVQVIFRPFAPDTTPSPYGLRRRGGVFRPRPKYPCKFFRCALTYLFLFPFSPAFLRSTFFRTTLPFVTCGRRLVFPVFPGRFNGTRKHPGWPYLRVFLPFSPHLLIPVFGVVVFYLAGSVEKPHTLTRFSFSAFFFSFWGAGSNVPPPSFETTSFLNTMESQTPFRLPLFFVPTQKLFQPLEDL